MTFDKMTTEKIENILEAFTGFLSTAESVGVLRVSSGYYIIYIDPDADTIAGGKAIKSADQMCESLMNGVCNETIAKYYRGDDLSLKDVETIVREIRKHYEDVIKMYPEYGEIADRVLSRNRIRS